MPDLGTHDFVELHEIGRGGFGIVYTARQPAFERTVAVKVLTLTDERTMRRFDRERHALGMVSNHPNITPVFASGFTTDGLPYLAMELMRGGSLADRLAAEGPMPWERVLALGVKLAGALETAHRAGILHRDLKPANILLSEYDEPRLADFGIASLDDGQQTRTGVITASVAYAAPEVLDGRRPGFQADVYGLAATLYTLIAGTAPFSVEEEESVLALVMRIARDPVPDLREHGVPDAFASVLETGMAKSSDDRYVTAAAFGAAMREAQRQLGLPQTPMVLPQSHGTTVTSLTTTTFDLTSDPDATSGPVPAAGPGWSAGPSPPASASDPAPTGEAGIVPVVSPWAVPRADGAPVGPGGGLPPGSPDPGSASPSRGRGRFVVVGVGVLLAATVALVAVQVLSNRGDGAAAPSAATSEEGGDSAVVPDDGVVDAGVTAPGVDEEPTAGSDVLAVPTEDPDDQEPAIVAATVDPPSEEPAAPVGGWATGRPAPIARQQAPGVELRGRVWVAGGLVADGVTTSVEGYEIASNSWREVTDLPLALHHHMTATFGSDLVVLGGWSPQGALLSATVSDRVLALRGGEWLDLPPLLQPRAAGAAANVGGMIVVVGGQDTAGQLATTTEVFDGQEWREGAPLPTPREHLAAATDGTYLYVVGGRVLSADTNLATVERYDPAADEWDSLPDLTTARGGLAATVVGGRTLVAIGGERVLGVFDEVEALDLGDPEAEWVELPRLPTGRHGLAAASVGSTIVTVGGALEPTHSTSTDVVEVIGVE